MPQVAERILIHRRVQRSDDDRNDSADSPLKSVTGRKYAGTSAVAAATTAVRLCIHALVPRPPLPLLPPRSWRSGCPRPRFVRRDPRASLILLNVTVGEPLGCAHVLPMPVEEGAAQSAFLVVPYVVESTPVLLIVREVRAGASLVRDQQGGEPKLSDASLPSQNATTSAGRTIRSSRPSNRRVRASP